MYNFTKHLNRLVRYNSILKPTQNKHFSETQNKHFSTTQNKHFSATQNKNFSATQNKNFSATQNKHFSTTQNKNFSATQILPTLVGTPAPNFTAPAVYPDDTVKQLTLSDFSSEDKYVCLFFWPYDFTFVCPSEIIAFNNAKQQFDERNVELIGASTDSQYVHQAWRRTPLNQGGIGAIDFPIISDVDKTISMKYGILHNEQCVSLRGLFLIDKTGVIRHALVNDLPLGRNVDEVIRTIDALQHNEMFGEVCPANWKKGQKAMNANFKGVSDYLGQMEQ